MKRANCLYRLGFCALPFGLALAGCETLDSHQADDVMNELNSRLEILDQPYEPPAATPVGTDFEDASAGEPRSPKAAEVQLGTGQFIDADKARASAADGELSDGEIVLNFQGADLQEVVQAVLGEMLGLPYVIDPGVAGTVSTDTTSGLSRADLLPILESLLAMNGAALVKRDGIYRVLPADKTVRTTARPIVGNLASGRGFGIQIVPLRYISNVEMQKILEPMLAEGALVYSDPQRNLLLLAGSAADRQRYLDTVDVFDVDWMQGMSVGLYPITYAEPDDIITEIESALGAEEGRVLSGLVKLTPIERLGAVLAVTASAPALNEIERWVRRLDVPGDSSAPQLFVYRLQNAKAADVAAILTEIFADRDDDSNRRPGAETAPGTRAVTASTDGAPAAPSPAGGGIAINVGEEVRIIADEPNNALVILATPREYSSVESAIRKLDVIPLQVLIEATIVEVTLNDSLEYGVEWFFKNSLPTNKQGNAVLDLGGTGIQALAPAFSYTVIDTADQIRAAFNILATESNLNVLSAPSLMVLDNQTATINVGDEIPIPTRQATSNLDAQAPTVNEIQYRETGVTLTITPRVNSGGLVTMEVEQEVSDAVATTSSDLNAPTIQQRVINSTVAVQSGETVILGGLIRTSKSVNQSGLPYIRRIPVIGKVFGQTSDFGRRTELLVLITPRAVTSGLEARQVTKEFRDKLRGLTGDRSTRPPY